MAEYIGQLNSGQSLAIGDILRSPNGLYGLFMQADGNLVLYSGVPSVATAVWATNTWALPTWLRPNRADMQGDGNFVLYNNANFASWSSGTAGNPGARLAMQDDRNLVIYTPGNQALWASGTAIPAPAQPQPTTRYEEQYIGWQKFVQSNAILYRNGLLTLESTNRNRNPAGGMRCHTLVVVQDAAGRAIWVSNDFEDPTRCSLFDWSCASDGVTTHTQQFPEPVGRFALSMDILVQDEASFVDLRDQFIRVIKATAEIAQEIKDVYDQLQTSG
jgi:hypothetical protein